jgi:hypothetical protein
MDPRQHDELITALRAAARGLAGRRSIRDLDQTLGAIVSSAVASIPGVDAGSISMTEGGRVETRHPSTEAVSKLDQTQSELGEGPCLSAIMDPPESGIVIAQDFAGDDAARWPRFAPAAVAAGFRALMSTELSTNGGPRAALNLYSATAHAFDEDARVLAGAFGVQAAMLLYGALTAAQLQRAVESRDVIGQAKGILMERFSLDADGAFEMLVKSSQETNIKLAEVAHWLTSETGNRVARDAAAPTTR